MEQWLAENWDLVLGTLSAVAFAASGILPESLAKDHWYSFFPPHWAALFVGGVLFVAAGVSVARKRRGQSQLLTRARTAEQELAGVRSELDEWQLSSARVMERLCEAFGAAMLSTPNERTSIYRAVPDDGSFVRLARHALNPRYQTSGRVKYPPDEGIVSEAWENMYAQRQMTRDMCGTDRRWANAMSEASGIPKATLLAMAMKSKTLFARRIDDPGSHEPCAVLVFESTRFVVDLDSQFTSNGGGSAEETFQRIFTQDLGVALVEAVSIMSRLRAQVDPDVATEEGF